MGAARRSRAAIGNAAAWRAGCAAPALLLTLSGCLTSGKPATPDATRARPAVVAASSGPSADASTTTADNSVCLVCHMDFAEEEMTAKHAVAGCGCTSCHGASAAHGNDELNITPPDVLFGRTEIDAFCRTCHPTHTAGEVYDAFLEKWRGERRPNGRMVMTDSVCTDCHGNHAVLRPDQLAEVPAGG